MSAIASYFWGQQSQHDDKMDKELFFREIESLQNELENLSTDYIVLRNVIANLYRELLPNDTPGQDPERNVKNIHLAVQKLRKLAAQNATTEGELKVCEERVRELEAKSRDLLEKETELSQQVQVAEKQRAKITELETEARENQEKLRAINQDIESLEKEKSQLQRQLQELREGLKDAETQIGKFKSQMDEKSRILDQERQKFAQLLESQQKNSTEMARIHEWNEKVRELEAKKKDNEAEIEKLENLIKHAKEGGESDTWKLKQLLEATRKVNVKLVKEMDEYKRLLNHSVAEGDLRVALNNAVEIQERIIRSQRHVRELEQEGVKNLKYELAQILENGLEGESEMKERSRELDDVNEKLSVLRGSKNVLQETIRRTREVQERTKRELDRHEKTISSALDKHAISVEQCMEEKRRLEKEVRARYEEIEKDLLPQREKALDEIRECQKENQRVQKEYEEQIAQLEKKHAEGVRDLQSQLRRQEKLHKDYYKDQNQAREEFKQHYEHLCTKRLEELKRIHRSDMDKQKEEIEKTERDFRETLHKFDELRKSSDRMYRNLEKCRDDLRSRIAQQEELQKELSSCLNRKEGIKKDRDIRDNEMEKLRRELEKCQEMVRKEITERETALRSAGGQWTNIQRIGEGYYYLSMLRSLGILKKDMNMTATESEVQKWLQNPKHRQLKCRHRQVTEAFQWLKKVDENTFLLTKSYIDMK
jgi:chromosome segregation ATPase